MKECMATLLRISKARFHQKPLGSAQIETCRLKDNDFATCVRFMHIVGRMCVLARHFTHRSYQPNRHVHNNKTFREHPSPLDVILCHLASGVQFFEESQCFHLQRQALHD